MSGVNKVILVGRLGKDPEVRNLENGATVANFTMATSESYRDKTTGDRKEITEWHNIVMWRSLAESAAKLLQKRSLVHLEGKARTRSFTDDDGHKKYTTEVVVDHFKLLGRKSDFDERYLISLDGGNLLICRMLRSKSRLMLFNFSLTDAELAHEVV